VGMQVRFAGAACIRRVTDNETLWHSTKFVGSTEKLVPRWPCTRAEAQPALHAAADNAVDNWMIAFRPGRSLLQLLLREPDDP